jgi:glutathionylspermidine amidase/synthetase
MKSADKPQPAPFGAVLGIAPGGVPAYSSDYETADERELPNRRAFRNYVDGVYLGYKWQCVEFARRWMYHNCGYIFDDVAMAYEIFRLQSVREVASGQALPLRSFRNGSRRHPEPGALLVWAEGGTFEHTGHVAVVTEVFPDRVRVAEQNVDHQPWPDDRDYSREIPAKVTDDGGYWLRCAFGEASILGWVIQTGDDRYAETFTPPEPRLFEILAGQVARPVAPGQSWLNVANPDEAAYVEMMGGHKLASRDENQALYYVVSETALEELKRATNELHALFLHATDYVLRDDSLLEKFNIPRAVWPRIQQSWDNRRTQMITGRFDFSLSSRGLKVYEYNCDSASCHMDTGKVQGRWAAQVGLSIGDDPGAGLQKALVAAWRESDVARNSGRQGGVLHIMIDRDLEETYHALFMQEALSAAGIRSKLLHGMTGITWNASGDIVDADGERIEWVWKTWAWETALDQLREECEDDEARLRLPGASPRDGAPRLVDVLLRPEVMVYEPLWTLIPSNKAILPVLSELFPDHAYLLDTAFELTGRIREGGYVQKPIVGRCGANIRLIDENHQIIEETSGRFDSPNQIYQQLWRLPNVAERNVQVCTFSAGGTYAGACVRIDRSAVISADSDIVALRQVDDIEHLDPDWPGHEIGEQGYQI